MKNTVSIGFIKILTLSLATTCATSALAGTVNETYVEGWSSEVPAVRIQFAATDLATTEGREAIVRRIDSASRQVCGPMNVRQAGGLSRVARNRDCYEESFGQAMSQIDALNSVTVVNISPAMH
jgi:UrcA family protein